MAERTMVRNAGSERQVRRAERKEKDFSDRRIDAMRQVLGTPVGRSLVWELLRMARVYETVWTEHGQRMAYNVGRQDYGHELMALCLEANENGYLLMEQEARRWQRREDQETDAAHTAGEDTEDQNDA